MDLDKLNFLPEWDDERFDDEEHEGDEWKLKEERGAAKAMYNKWREVFGLVIAFTELLDSDDENVEKDKFGSITSRLIWENAMIVGPKISGAVHCDLYILKMENAAIIRTNCMQLIIQVSSAVMFEKADKAHEKAIKETMSEFRELFKNWVSHFQKDEFEDEWGLFN